VRLAIALLVCVALSAGALVSVERGDADASTAGPAVALRAIGRSPAAAGTESALLDAAANPATAQISKDLLAQPGAALTPFDRSLLELGVRFGAPQNQALIARLGSGTRLGRQQTQALQRLLAAVAFNPAIMAVNQQGRELQRDPSRLRAGMAEAQSAPGIDGYSATPSGDPALDSITGGIEELSASAEARSVVQAAGSALSEPGADDVVRRMPPLVVASFAPQDEAAVLDVPGPSAATQGIAAAAEAPSKVGTLLQLAKDLVLTTAKVLALRALKNSVFGIGVFIFAGLVLGVVSPGAAAALVALYNLTKAALIYRTLKTLVVDAVHAIEAFSIDRIALTPSSDLLVANAQRAFTVTGFHGSEVVGDVTRNATLSISPDGSCDDATHSCTAKVAGIHTVSATMSGLTTSATLVVTPAALDRIVLSPSTQTAPPNVSRAFTAEGFDEFDNAIDLADDEWTLSITNGTCNDVQHTCAASTPGPHTVFATSGTVGGTATLIVEEVEEPPGTVTISPSSLPAVRQCEYYSFTLHEQGIPVADSIIWGWTAASIPTVQLLRLGISNIPGTQDARLLIQPGTASPGVYQFTVYVGQQFGSTNGTRTYALNVQPHSAAYNPDCTPVQQ
jgi:hypothetical protein